MLYILKCLFCYIFLGHRPCIHKWSSWTLTLCSLTENTRTQLYGCEIAFTRRCLHCQKAQTLRDSIDSYNNRYDAIKAMERRRQALYTQLGVNSSNNT